MKAYQAKDVNEYIALAPKEAQATLKEIRKVIKAAVPGVEEGISWGIPFYRHNGLLAGFSAFKKHASFGFCTILEKTERDPLEKKGFVTTRKIIQIRFDQKVPAAAIKKIVKTRAKANASGKKPNKKAAAR